MATVPPIRMPDRWPAAVVFDMDGLMLDSERVARDLWHLVLREQGYEFSDTRNDSLVGRSEADSNGLLSAHFGTAFPVTAVRAVMRARWYECVASQGLPHKHGLVELLDFLASVSLPIAVATSTERGKALKSLSHLVRRFQATAFGDEVTHAKPAPDLYLLAAERLRTQPEDCLALEDSPAGLAAAQAAGMTTILIPDLVTPTTLPQFYCQTLGDVTTWLQGIAAGRTQGRTVLRY